MIPCIYCECSEFGCSDIIIQKQLFQRWRNKMRRKITEEWIEEKATELLDIMVIIGFVTSLKIYKKLKDFIRSLIEEIT